MLTPWKKSYDQPRQHIQKQRHYFANKVCLAKAMVFQRSWMDVRVGLWRKLNAEELMLLNCVVGENSWEPLDCKEIQPVHPKGDQTWVFFGRIDAKAETPILWPPDAKNWLIGKDPDVGKDWRHEEKGTTEDEMVGWHHWLNGMNLSKLQETVKERKAWHAAVHRVAESDTT